MKLMAVYKDKDGSLINIGDWDDMGGANPIPEGAYQDTADIVVGYDGGLYLADDPRANGVAK